MGETKRRSKKSSSHSAVSNQASSFMNGIEKFVVKNDSFIKVSRLLLLMLLLRRAGSFFGNSSVNEKKVRDFCVCLLSFPLLRSFFFLLLGSYHSSSHQVSSACSHVLVNFLFRKGILSVWCCLIMGNKDRERQQKRNRKLFRKKHRVNESKTGRKRRIFHGSFSIWC